MKQTIVKASGSKKSKLSPILVGLFITTKTVQAIETIVSDTCKIENGYLALFDIETI
jgi:hypothetical protein